MELNPGAFNGLLQHMGQKVLYRKAFACPCKNPHSGASDSKCPHCAGKGYLWDPAVNGVVGVTGSKVQKEWAQSGTYETGDSVVSIGSDSPLYDMGQGDRATMLNGAEAFSITLVRGAPDERLIGKIESISRVFWLDAQKKLTQGGKPIVADNGTLTWADGEPPAGVQYGISGIKFPEFFCWGAFPSTRNMHQGARLPRRVVLRRFDLWGRAKD